MHKIVPIDLSRLRWVSGQFSLDLILSGEDRRKMSEFLNKLLHQSLVEDNYVEIIFSFKRNINLKKVKELILNRQIMWRKLPRGVNQIADDFTALTTQYLCLERAVEFQDEVKAMINDLFLGYRKAKKNGERLSVFYLNFSKIHGLYEFPLRLHILPKGSGSKKDSIVEYYNTETGMRGALKFLIGCFLCKDLGKNVEKCGNPECGKIFIRKRISGKYCSEKCSNTVRNKKKLDQKKKSKRK